jgi:gliding-associated putative ABC transporter substrate-binding component GldG
MNSGKINTKIILIVGIVVFLNLLADQFFFRFDFTEEKQYTLSKATRNILAELNEPVTVKAYFSEQLPPDVAKTKKDFKELLIEYSNLSKGMLVYEFINPNEDEKIEQEALQNGVQPVMINVREKDQMKQQKAYLGAVISYGEKKEIIPFMQPGGAMEYALTSAIKKLAVHEKPTVAILQGHGEPAIAEMQQVNAALSVLYNIENIELKDSTDISSSINTIAIVRPKDSVSFYELQKLDLFLNRGGKLMIALNRVDGDFQTAYGKSVSTGIESWLASKGLIIDDNFVIDSRCGAVTVQQQQGMFTFQSQVQFPYIPILNKFADHPITKGLETVVMQFASAINYTGDSSLKFTPLAFTSEQSGFLKAPQYFDIQKQWTQNDFPAKNLVVAASLENNANNSKIVLIGDGDFPVNGERGRAQQLQPDNVNLMVNAIDWLSDDTGLIDLRTRGTTSRPLNQLEDSTKSLLKYLNFFLPVLLVVIYGFIRMQLKRSERIRRMEENYNY